MVEHMRRIEYKTLRKITGRYHRSSHRPLAAIAAVEPLEAKLDDLSASWTAKAPRTEDHRYPGC